MSRGRILVIRGGAIGDFILTLPALAAVRRQFPQTHLAVLGYPAVAGLAALGGYADEVKSIEARPLAGFFARRGTLDTALGDWFGGFSIIISYLYDPDGIFQENVGRVSQAQFIAGPHRPAEDEPTHATDALLRPLLRLAIFDAEAEPSLRLPAISRTPDLLAIHPGSGSEKKNWPEPRWRELLDRILAGTKWRVLLVGGEAEGDRLARLAAGRPADRVERFESRPLTDLAARLAGCAGFLGHDSGISHLAAAVGLPGVVLWGPTRAEIWRPRSGSFELLRADGGLPALAVEPVYAAVARFMP